MKLVPQLLYKHDKVTKIMVDGLSCIVHKTLDTVITRSDHYVTSHVLSVVLKGALDLETYYDGERFVATQNQVVLIPKGRYMISDVVPDDGAFEAVFFFFEEDIITNFLASVKGVEPPERPYSLILKYTEPIRIFTENILALYDGSHNPKESTKLKLMELLYLLYYSEQKGQLLALLNGLNVPKHRNLQELMLSNYDKPLGVEDYAFLSGRSMSTFVRDFQRQFNTSPKQWLIHKRLEKAQQLLSTTDLSIQQVALESGYESSSYFISLFGKHFGLSPKQFMLQKRPSL